ATGWHCSARLIPWPRRAGVQRSVVSRYPLKHRAGAAISCAGECRAALSLRKRRRGIMFASSRHQLIQSRNRGSRPERVALALLGLAICWGPAVAQLGSAADLSSDDELAVNPPDEEITVRGQKPLRQYRLEL